MTHKNLIFIGLIIYISASCNLKHEGIDRPADFFLKLDYSKIDTTVTNNSDSIFVFNFDGYSLDEKVYLEKGKIKHVFGQFDDKGTFWLNEWITYTNQGRILDNESQYVVVSSKHDSTEFDLIGEEELNFKLRIYNIEDSIRGELIKEISPTYKNLTIASTELVGKSASLMYLKEFEKDSAKEVRKLEVYFNRDYKRRSLKNLGLIKDNRIITIANKPL
ncbi:hypothetical protein [Carboxylicivirga sp. M1479]|uniref:hypothetical protein n=1 Tax=Carboxylicivirga sp. M1479 TaxID=2594476 RepID=UPI001178ACD3|nr:hypothetical protein [Carboxylicivirga sp. M1479]TRX59790.1 hypothetical protein FNN09_20845 [Carboxylicivirga sp. M1479]